MCRCLWESIRYHKDRYRIKVKILSGIYVSFVYLLGKKGKLGWVVYFVRGALSSVAAAEFVCDASVPLLYRFVTGCQCDQHYKYDQQGCYFLLHKHSPFKCVYFIIQ